MINTSIVLIFQWVVFIDLYQIVRKKQIYENDAYWSTEIGEFMYIDVLCSVKLIILTTIVTIYFDYLMFHFPN